MLWLVTAATAVLCGVLTASAQPLTSSSVTCTSWGNANSCVVASSNVTDGLIACGTDYCAFNCVNADSGVVPMTAPACFGSAFDCTGGHACDFSCGAYVDAQNHSTSMCYALQVATDTHSPVRIRCNGFAGDLCPANACTANAAQPWRCPSGTCVEQHYFCAESSLYCGAGTAAQLTTLQQQDLAALSNIFAASAPWNGYAANAWPWSSGSTVNPCAGGVPASPFVSCNVACQRVSGLLLGGVGMHGSVQDVLTAITQGSLASALVTVDLHGNSLTGPVADSFSATTLPRLQKLDLSGNTITGAFPATLSLLPKLADLSVASNQMNGALPVLSSLANGGKVNMDNNQFSGPIPSGVLCNGPLTSCSILGTQQTYCSPLADSDCPACSLVRNSYCSSVQQSQRAAELQALLDLKASASTNGTWAAAVWSTWPTTAHPCASASSHPSWADCANGYLSGLHLASSNLAGPLPASFGNLLNLRQLDLSGNYLTGSLPSSFATLTALVSVNLNNNHFSGPLPDAFAALTTLQSFTAANNQFTETLPPTLAFHAQVQVLDLSNNALDGALPTFSATSLTSVTTLNLANNALNGSLTGALCTKAFASCSLLGPQQKYCSPTSDNACTGCAVVRNNYCDTAVQAQRASELQALQDLQASASQGGPWTSPYWSQWPTVSHPCVSATVHPSFVTCGNGFLTGLSLPNANLNGTLPASFGNLVHLLALDLSSNHLTGQLPDSFGQLTSLTSLNLYGNAFTGDLPSAMASFTGLVVLNLGGNLFSGSFPDSLCLLPYSAGNCVLTGARNCFQLSTACAAGSTCVLQTALSQCPSAQQQVESACLTQLQTSTQTASQQWAQYGAYPMTPHPCLFQPPPPFITCSSASSTAAISGIALPNNNLVGSLPSCLSSFTFLVSLDLSNNGLSGSMAPVGSLPALRTLNLDGNAFSGALPANPCSTVMTLCSMVGSEQAYCSPTSDTTCTSCALIRNNYCDATVIQQRAVELLALNDLLAPRLKQNGPLVQFDNLTLTAHPCGSLDVPSFLGCANGFVTSIVLKSNNLAGPLPTSLSNFAYLRTLDLSDNHLSGAIPSGLGDIASLNSLRLTGNALSGLLPSSLCSKANLAVCDLTGIAQSYCPPSSGVCTACLTEPSYDCNPSQQAQRDQELIALQDLVSKTKENGPWTQYDDVTFSVHPCSAAAGTKPPAFIVCSSGYVTSISLSKNNLAGKLSSSIGYLTSLVYLDLSDNNLSGPLPASLGRLPLQLLDLQNNQFSSALPASLCDSTKTYGTCNLLGGSQSYCLTNGATTCSNCLIVAVQCNVASTAGWTTAVIVGSVVAFTALAYVICRYRNPGARNTVVITVVLGIFDIVTDVLFVVSLAALSVDNPKVYGAYIASLVFLVVTLLSNFLLVIYVLRKRVRAHTAWFESNSAVAAVVAMLGSCQVEILSLLTSNILRVNAFNMQWSPVELREVIVLGGFTILFENVPQLAIQIYVLTALPATSITAITLITIASSALAIMFGLFRRLILFFVQSNTAGKSVNDGSEDYARANTDSLQMKETAEQGFVEPTKENPDAIREY